MNRLPAHLAPLGLPGAFYRVVDGQVVRHSGQPVDVETSLSVAVDMAVTAPTEERAALWSAQLNDLITAAREARSAQPLSEAA